MSSSSRRGAIGRKPKRAGVPSLLICSGLGAATFATPPRNVPNHPGPNMALNPVTMETLSDANPIDHGRNFLTGGRTAGMNEAQYCSFLGDNPRTQRVDRDNFAFDGTAGEEIAIRLASDGTNFSGTHASLAISDQIRNVQFFRADHSALPNALRGRLPATGRYVITVQQQQQGTARERPFTGDYCVTLRSTGNAAASLRPTDSVEDAANAPPTADAGPDQSVVDADRDGSENVQLDGSGSADADGRVVSFDWSENGKSLAQGAQPRVNLTVGRHVITLTVTDDEGATGTDDVHVMVEENTAECLVDEDCPDDQNACTDTYCTDGQCENVFIDLIECNDFDACTIESCDPTDGCQYTPIDCDDGLFCNGLESCDQGACVSAGSPCAAGLFCDESVDACVECLTGAHCNDNAVCTADTCTNGVCQNSDIAGCCESNNDCNDGTMCTLDQCINHVCSHPPINCSDGNACTMDTCNTTTGCIHTPISCDDGNVCTDDSCDTRLGCANDPNTVACDDEDFCTSGDTCSAGVCGGQSVDCDDGLFCTGVEFCIDGDCASTGNPCAEGQFCDEENGCSGLARTTNLRSGTTTTSTRSTMSATISTGRTKK